MHYFTATMQMQAEMRIWEDELIRFIELLCSATRKEKKKTSLTNQPSAHIRWHFLQHESSEKTRLSFFLVKTEQNISSVSVERERHRAEHADAEDAD